MSDTTDTPRERKPLGLKRSIDAGEVKQTFSHGRTNKVVVEVKRRRVIGKPGETPAPAPASSTRPGAWGWMRKALALPACACHWTARLCLWHWAATTSSTWH